MHFEQLGPYKIGRRLGRGGMGTVYEGVETSTGQVVAVKLLSPALTHDAAFRERFEAEIETLKKLKHPNIVQLFGYGRQDEYLFYSMELVDGISLEEELQVGRRFDWREATMLGVQTCRALKHAHDRGIVHRDIKPANLLLASDGTVKLSDFGIAKLFGGSSLTADGGVLGTADYMAPEQADGRPVTYKADLYSVGGVLYALLARRPPFRAKSLFEMLQLQRYATPEPLRRFAPDAPRELESIVGQLLEKDPERRIANAQVLSRRLEAMERGLSLQASRAEQAAVDDAGVSLEVHTKLATGAEAALPHDATLAADYSLQAPASEGFRGPSAPTRGAAVDADASDRANLPPRQFVPVSDAERGAAETSESNTTGVALQIAGLVLGLAVVAALGFYLLRAPSADELYDRIKQTPAEKATEAEPDLKRFLTTYADDPRAAELRELSNELELERLEKSFEQRARRLGKTDSLVPAERSYLEAISLLRVAPELGEAKLRALLDLYAENAAPDRATERCLQLARRKLAQIEEQIAADAPAHLKLLAKRLERAKALDADDPETARRIRAAIVALYADKPWAAETVRQARAELPPETPPP